MMKIATVIGARPQFIKAATISRLIKEDKEVQEIIIHTGQHYDDNMSKVFFNELNIPKPHYNLDVGSSSHGKQTGDMMTKIEKVFMDENPDWVLVYGDTNSTLAAALVASKMHIPIIHVEAGLRSYNMDMPEEINRILTDRISSLLFCPTNEAVHNLSNEGFNNFKTSVQVFNYGDVMYDAALYYADLSEKKLSVIEKYGLTRKEYALVTCHRAENTDNIDRLTAIRDSLVDVSNKLELIFPIHPRTKKILKQADLYKKLHEAKNVKIVDPLGYLEIVQLQKNSKLVITDSGGMQKEAYFHKVPCVTLRDETEWVETIELGCNRLVKPLNKKEFINQINLALKTIQNYKFEPYGDGKAANKILNKIKEQY